MAEIRKAAIVDVWAETPEGRAEIEAETSLALVSPPGLISLTEEALRARGSMEQDDRVNNTTAPSESGAVSEQPLLAVDDEVSYFSQSQQKSHHGVVVRRNLVGTYVLKKRREPDGTTGATPPEQHLKTYADSA